MFNFLKPKEFIFINIEENKLEICKLEKRKDCFTKKEESFYNYSLLNNEIFNEKICNPTFLSEQILNYFQNNKLTNPIIIISAQYLTSTENINHKILQLIMALNKVPGIIQLITNTNIFNNKSFITETELKQKINLLTPFYPSPKTSPTQWLCITAFIIIILATSGASLISYKKNQIKEINLKIQALKEKIKDVKNT